MEVQIDDLALELVQGDITDLEVDAIVNAANQYLILGSGVAGAIRAKGGPSIQAECDRIGGTPVGTAVITGAGNLKARHVIHAVGPRMGEGNEGEKLASAVRSSLDLAVEHGLRSIAFPAISTGVFGYPLEACARVTLHVIIDFATRDHGPVEKVIICLYDERAYNIFSEELTRQLSA